MTDTEVRTLMRSTRRGHWTLMEEDSGDLTVGQPVLLMLGGAMITGHITHGGRDGFHFQAENGSVCGFCTGMRVRRL